MITDLPEEVATRTQPPPFETVVARVREDRRRAWRRTAVAGGVLALAALVVVPQLGGGSAKESLPNDPGPSVPTPSSGLAMGVPELLARPDVSVITVSGSDDGGVAVLWQGCASDGTGCDYAVLTYDGKTLGSVVVDSTVLDPTSRGWLIHTPGGWRELGSDGWVSGVTTAGEDGVRPGDEVVETAGGLGLLRGDRLLLLPTSSGTPTQAYVTPSGRLLEVSATGDGSERLRVTTDGRTWTTIRSWAAGGDVSQVRLAGRGRTVVMVELRPWQDSFLLDGVEVSHDAGATWTAARGLDLASGEVANLTGLAVSARGTVYLTTQSDGLIRVDRAGNAQVSALSKSDSDVFATTYQVCALTGGWGPRIACSDDDGTSWSRQAIPGASLVGGR